MKEYDKRVELLTREKGRISAFAQGARRVNSALSACTIPFTFGEYVIHEGSSANTIKSASIQRFFGTMAEDYDMLCYASYFSEMAQYFTRENIEASQELLLLYVTFAAMEKKLVPLPLIRVIYEMRMMQLQGQGIELFECLYCHETGTNQVFLEAGGLVCDNCLKQNEQLKRKYPLYLSHDAQYSLQYILTTPLPRLYGFTVSEEVQQELVHFMKRYLGRYLPHTFKSLQFIAAEDF